MKKKTDLIFNAAKYEHLNKQLPFSEWIAEILSRNNTFRADHGALIQLKEQKEIAKFQKELFVKYKVHVPALPALPSKIRIAIPPTISVGRITDRQDLTAEEKEYLGCTPDEITFGNIKIDLTLYTDTLLVTINLNRPKEEIQREIDKAIHTHKKRKAGNLRLDKWKYHLIAFDLNNAGYTYNDIGNALQKAFTKEDDRDCFSPETIRKYVREGKNLVDKIGYIKYI